MTASGLTTKDFEVNDAGFYTYQGKVVLATANTTRLNWSLKQGYSTHNLFDELIIEIDEIRYRAVVIDVCGACYGVQNESIQRYDIFTVKDVVGLKKGNVYEK